MHNCTSTTVHTCVFQLPHHVVLKVLVRNSQLVRLQVWMKLGASKALRVPAQDTILTGCTRCTVSHICCLVLCPQHLPHAGSLLPRNGQALCLHFLHQWEQVFCFVNLLYLQPSSIHDVLCIILFKGTVSQTTKM